MNSNDQPPITRWPNARSPVVGRVEWWRFVAGGLAHGLFMYFAFPPASVWPLAFLALAPLVWSACKGAATPVRAGLWTGVGVLPFWAMEHAWLIDVTGPGAPALAAYLTIYSMVFVWAVATARGADWPIPMSVVVPVVWTGLEMLRGSVTFTGYAFYLLGHPLIDNPVLAAPAAVIGAYGVSFLCAIFAGALADATGWSGLPRHAGGIAALAGIVLWTAMSVVGTWSGRPGPTQEVRIAVVQTNVAQDNKMAWAVGQRLKDFARFCELTRQAAAQRPEPDLIVWPETMFPGYALNAESVEAERRAGLRFRIDDPDYPPDSTVPATVFADELLKMQADAKVGVPLLVGAIAAEGVRIEDRPGGGILREVARRYNSALVVREGRVQEKRYDKVDLMPFGEVIPYVWRWPRVQKWIVGLGAAGMSFDLAFGARAGPLDVRLGRAGSASADHLAAARIATPICFEVTRSGLCRRLVNGDGTGRAGLMINLSNDGWFGASDAGRRTHLLSARWRSVELGVPMVRAVNTGVSCGVDWRGRMTAERVVDAAGTPTARPTRVEGVLTAVVGVEPTGHATVFTHLGEWPMAVVSGLGGVGMLAVWRRRRAQSRLGV